MRSLRIVAVMALVLFPSTVVAPAQADGPGRTVILHDMKYVPAEITINVGESVLWRHDDGMITHTVTAVDGSFDSHPKCGEGGPCMVGGDTYTRTFDTAGTVTYACKAMGSEAMSATVTVVG